LVEVVLSKDFSTELFNVFIDHSNIIEKTCGFGEPDRKTLKEKYKEFAAVAEKVREVRNASLSSKTNAKLFDTLVNPRF